MGIFNFSFSFFSFCSFPIKGKIVLYTLVFLQNYKRIQTLHDSQFLLSWFVTQTRVDLRGLKVFCWYYLNHRNSTNLLGVRPSRYSLRRLDGSSRRNFLRRKEI